MKSSVLPVPGIVLGTYPERRASTDAPAARDEAGTRGRSVRRYHAFVRDVRAAETAPAAKSGATGVEMLNGLRARFSQYGLADALIAEAAAESLGATLELRDGPDGQAEVWALLGR